MLPAGHSIISLAELPELRRPQGELNVSVWPEFMLHDATSDRLWGHLYTDFPAYQLCLFNAHGELVAGANAAPLAWDGTDEDLPDGWDQQLERSVADAAAGRAVDTLGAIQVVVRPEHQGSRYSGTMVQAMLAMAREHAFRALIACVRPTEKERYPLIPIERYVAWMRADGLPFDPWIRLHVRLGGRIVRPSPSSMVVEGTIAEWAEWTGLSFPESGSYLPRGAAAPLDVDVEADHGVYRDPNVWIVHGVA